MRSFLSIKRLALFTALAASTTAFAAGPDGSPKAGSADSHMHGGMMGNGMMGGGMMDMMHSCQSMMGGGAGMASLGLPKLPPGNEKLEVQMHAEMLQKLGEIEGRYAERIKENR